MNALVSVVTGFAYKRMIKPVLFRFSPDKVHDRMIRSGARLQCHQSVRTLLVKSLRYDNPVRLQQTLHGITFPTPIGLSAGLDKNFELVPLMHAVGFGFMEGGSITLRPCAGNPRPWFYRLPKSKSLVVHAGLANHGAPEIIGRLRTDARHLPTGFPLNVSVAKTNSPEAVSDTDAISDYVGSLSLLKTAGIGAMYTLNISCPNTYGGEPFTTPAKLDKLLAEVDKLKLQKPVFIKMPIDLTWDKFCHLLKVAEQHKVAGVTIGNLTKRRESLRDRLPQSVKGHLSGLPTREQSTYLIHQTYQKFGDRFTIIGVGGVFSAADAYDKIRHGAHLVELVTGIIFEGPQLVGQVNRDLVKLLERDGFRNVAEAVGSATSSAD
ncbi:dihydroorotate dehydrogenase 2, nonfunctional [Candidatus Saccharibacteria bacterium RAAC3_TM7_1]|nr:dihydroorotate dehydrogenase 2, nonfunctional [Candidatus Saccharibacteria bacterium RAAC3_TM7_1]HCZ28588.1 quinone-dependent dihydroorotate dehydrogenase [Candidatus Saccharibacteria bacterium]